MAAMCLFASLALAYGFFTRERVNSLQDLVEVSGPLANYSFRDGSRGSHGYYLHVAGCLPAFQIRADDIDLFDKADFIRSVHQGDWITLGVSRRSYEKHHDEPDRMQLFMIRTKDEQFLRPLGVIEANNSFNPMIFSSLFLLAAVAALLSRGIKAE